jgi:hypothetical protein
MKFSEEKLPKRVGRKLGKIIREEVVAKDVTLGTHSTLDKKHIYGTQKTQNIDALTPSHGSASKIKKK